ncbi:Z1 domain-containing protein, partial [Klebsiella pneumoniae]
MPASLVEAIQAFILTCCIRQLRGQQNEHSSMLVHVTRFNLVQQHVHRQIEDYVSLQKQRVMRKIDHETFISDLRKLWDND